MATATRARHRRKPAAAGHVYADSVTVGTRVLWGGEPVTITRATPCDHGRAVELTTSAGDVWRFDANAQLREPRTVGAAHAAA